MRVCLGHQLPKVLCVVIVGGYDAHDLQDPLQVRLRGLLVWDPRCLVHRKQRARRLAQLLGLRENGYRSNQYHKAI